MFTKQHFEAIAKLIKESSADGKTVLAQDMAKLFKKDNERFNTTRFLKACGLTVESA